jgi:hypothetical protein
MIHIAAKHQSIPWKKKISQPSPFFHDPAYTKYRKIITASNTCLHTLHITQAAPITSTDFTIVKSFMNTQGVLLQKDAWVSLGLCTVND